MLTESALTFSMSVQATTGVFQEHIQNNAHPSEPGGLVLEPPKTPKPTGAQVPHHQSSVSPGVELTVRQ